jgi:hypothetical protein
LNRQDRQARQEQQDKYRRGKNWKDAWRAGYGLVFIHQLLDCLAFLAHLAVRFTFFDGLGGSLGAHIRRCALVA